jgi:predicted nucleic acid-binding protein
MADRGFLDTGVVFGYCVPVDQHHSSCVTYVEEDNDLYVSDEIESEYIRMKEERVDELADDVRDHVKHLESSNLEAQLDRIKRKLRQAARDLETIALKRKRSLDKETTEWEPQDPHGDVRSTLSMIHQQDLDICIHAHDLACCCDSETEFATANPTDFIDDGRETVNLEATELADIVDLANR